MAAGQKGTEFALCLNSFNRDVQAYPEPNDFKLDLMDRYDLQMMVLGSFEFPFNQWTVEEPWSHFCFDVGLSFPSFASRTLTFVQPPLKDVVFLPAPFLAVRRLSVTSRVYEGRDARGDPVAHGLGFGSLSCFREDAVRIVLVPAALPPPGQPPFPVLRVAKVISPTQVEVDVPPPAGASMDGVLVVASANTRTFESPAALAECLQAFCSQPFPGLESLRRLSFQYSREDVELTLDVTSTLRGPACGPRDPEDTEPLVLNLENSDNLLVSLGFNLPYLARYVLPASLSASNFPQQSSCRAPSPIVARGLPARPVCIKYDVSTLPPTCTEAAGPPCSELGLCTQCVQIPPGNYEWGHLQKVTEHRMNNRAFLEIPVPTGGPAATLIVISTWGGPSSPPDTVEVATAGPIVSFHPAPIAAKLSEAFDAAATKLRWTYEDDRFVVRPAVPGTIFRITWPQGEGSQMLPFRLRIDESVTFATEIIGEKLNYLPSPTVVHLPLTHELTQVASTKRFVFTARPKLVPGSPFPVEGIPVVANLGPGEDVVRIPLGSLPLEVAVLLYDGGNYSAATARFGVVVCNSSAQNATYVQLLSPVPATGITTAWRANAVPLNGGAVNLYFPRAQAHCWSRLAEIFGFPSGATLWREPALVAPWQWNLDAPPYVLLDLGLQHVSATITHRCGNSVLSQFFGKIVLYPPFKEMRMTPIQAIGTGVSVVSSLHLRILNPWHQLYELHGRNWSITVILATNTKGGRTDCL